MNPAAALTPESFDLISIFLRADWVVKLVMIGLALASLWSWTVIIDKAVPLHRAEPRGQRLRGRGRLGPVAWRRWPPTPAQHPAHALPRMLQAALQEWRDGRAARGRSTRPSRLPDPAHRPRAGHHHRPRERQRVENGLGGLAIVATASPFIGLFGTVWGIMHAFQAIAIAEEHLAGHRRPGDRRGPVRHGHRPGRGHPGLYRLQQVLDRRGQVRRPAGRLRRRPVDRDPAPPGASGPDAMALSATTPSPRAAASGAAGAVAARARRAERDQRHARWST